MAKIANTSVPIVIDSADYNSEDPTIFMHKNGYAYYHPTSDTCMTYHGKIIGKVPENKTIDH